MFASITLDPGQVDERILDFSGLLREGYSFGSPLTPNSGQSCSTVVGHVFGYLCRDDSKRKHVPLQGIR